VVVSQSVAAFVGVSLFWGLFFHVWLGRNRIKTATQHKQKNKHKKPVWDFFIYSIFNIQGDVWADWSSCVRSKSSRGSQITLLSWLGVRNGLCEVYFAYAIMYCLWCWWFHFDTTLEIRCCFRWWLLQSFVVICLLDQEDKRRDSTHTRLQTHSVFEFISPKIFKKRK